MQSNPNPTSVVVCPPSSPRLKQFDRVVVPRKPRGVPAPARSASMQFNSCCVRVKVLRRGLSTPAVRRLCTTSLTRKRVDPREEFILEPLEESLELAVSNHAVRHCPSTTLSRAVHQRPCSLAQLRHRHGLQRVCLHRFVVVRTHTLHVPTKAFHYWWHRESEKCCTSCAPEPRHTAAEWRLHSRAGE
jgi:hypothetical protein